MALNSYLNQTYPSKQLIILDDWDDPSFPEPPEFAGVCYLRTNQLTIADKRNFCCSVASGDYICHVDDDDWSDPARMALQVDQLQTLQSDCGGCVVGYNAILLYDASTGLAYKFAQDRDRAYGTSLMYTREVWKRRPFHDGDVGLTGNVNIGEDNAFVKQAYTRGEFRCFDGGQLMVARIHAGNTSPKEIRKYHPVPVDAIPRGFFA